MMAPATVVQGVEGFEPPRLLYALSLALLGQHSASSGKYGVNAPTASRQARTEAASIESARRGGAA